MTTLKRGRNRVSSAAPDTTLPFRESSQQLEDSKTDIPSKRQKVIGSAEHHKEPATHGNTALSKGEVDNKENIRLWSRTNTDIEVVDLLDDDEETEETEDRSTKGKSVPERGLEKLPRSELPVGSAQQGINVGPPRGIQVKTDNSGENKSSEGSGEEHEINHTQGCYFSRPPRSVIAHSRGNRTKPSHKDNEKLTEEDEINKAANFISRAAMPDLDDHETNWMDQIIHSRPSANGALNRLELDADGRVQLTQEEIMHYLTSLENRPGHVKRRRQLVKATDLHIKYQTTVKTEKAVAGEASAKTETPDRAGSGHQEDEDEEVDPIQEEKDRVIEAARRLGCKRKKKLVVRSEEVVDDPDLDGQEVRSEPEDLIFIAEGPDGRPRRYRRIEELRTFWTVPGMTTPLLDHQILGVDWMVNDKELTEKGIHGGLVADMMGLGKVN
jgi:hypothetical protein